MQKIGIDPGLGGGIAFVDDGDISLFDMPVKPCPWAKGKRMVDNYNLKRILDCAFRDAQVTIELVHAMPKQGVSSVFTFGGAFYSAIAVVECLGLPLKLVRPQAWKSKCGLLNTDKDASRILALQMYPHLADQLKLKKHNGRSDALFIAIS